jgi:hypothetical protein
MLDSAVLKDIATKSGDAAARRAAVLAMREAHERADRSAVRYRSRRPEETELRARLRSLAGEGVRLNRSCAGSTPRSGCRRAAGAAAGGHWGTQAPIALPNGVNQRWSLDFVSDTLSDGRRLPDAMRGG